MNRSRALLIVIHNFPNAYSSARDKCRAAQTQMTSVHSFSAWWNKRNPERKQLSLHSRRHQPDMSNSSREVPPNSTPEPLAITPCLENSVNLLKIRCLQKCSFTDLHFQKYTVFELNSNYHPCLSRYSTVASSSGNNTEHRKLFLHSE